MKVIKNLFNFYLHSSIHVALSVISLVAITNIYLQLEWDVNLLLFVFFASVSGYNFIKYATVAGWKHSSLNLMLRVIQVFSFLCFLGMCWLVFKIPLRAVYLLIIIVLLVFLYVFPLRLNGKNLRSIPFFKIPVVAVVWAIVTVFFPVIYVDNVIDNQTVMLFIQRFLLVVVLMLPFEIRDLKFDELKLQTVPQLMGIKNTKILGIILLLGIIFIEFFFLETRFFWIACFVYFLTAVLLLNAKESRSFYYTAFWVEAIPVFWMGLIILSQMYLYR